MTKEPYISALNPTEISTPKSLTLDNALIDEFLYTKILKHQASSQDMNLET